MDAIELINVEILRRFRNFPATPTPEQWQEEWKKSIFRRDTSPQPSEEVCEAIAALWWWDCYGKHV